MDIEPILAVSLFALLCNLDAFHSNLFCIVAKQPYSNNSTERRQKSKHRNYVIQNTFLIILKIILKMATYLYICILMFLNVKYNYNLLFSVFLYLK